jgi:hypothetical protein
MKIALGYAAVAVVVIFMATVLVTTLRPAVEAPFAAVSSALAGAK